MHVTLLQKIRVNTIHTTNHSISGPGGLHCHELFSFTGLTRHFVASWRVMGTFIQKERLGQLRTFESGYDYYEDQPEDNREDGRRRRCPLYYASVAVFIYMPIHEYMAECPWSLNSCSCLMSPNS